MTFEEMEALLPQGFHDAFLIGVSVDYVTRQAELFIEVWTGSLDGSAAEREAYRRIRLTFTGLLLCAIDVPDGEYLTEKKPHGLDFDVAYDEKAEASGWPDEPLPSGAFRRTFYFTNDLNSRVRIAATNVEMEWLTEARTIY